MLSNSHARVYLLYVVKTVYSVLNILVKKDETDRNRKSLILLDNQHTCGKSFFPFETYIYAALRIILLDEIEKSLATKLRETAIKN